jgi:hypothetical protein
MSYFLFVEVGFLTIRKHPYLNSVNTTAENGEKSLKVEYACDGAQNFLMVGS